MRDTLFSTVADNISILAGEPYIGAKCLFNKVIYVQVVIKQLKKFEILAKNNVTMGLLQQRSHQY